MRFRCWHRLFLRNRRFGQSEYIVGNSVTVVWCGLHKYYRVSSCPLSVPQPSQLLPFVPSWAPRQCRAKFKDIHLKSTLRGGFTSLGDSFETSWFSRWQISVNHSFLSGKKHSERNPSKAVSELVESPALWWSKTYLTKIRPLKYGNIMNRHCRRSNFCFRPIMPFLAFRVATLSFKLST